MSLGFLQERRVQYNKEKERLEWIATIEDLDFVYDAMPCKKIHEDYMTLEDRSATEILIGAVPYRVQTTGVPTFRILNQVGGGMRGSCLFAQAFIIEEGGTTTVDIWDVSKDIYTYVKFRFPNPTDLFGFEFQIALQTYVGWQNHFIGFAQTNLGVAPADFFFYTSNPYLTNDTTTNLGPLDNDWYEFFFKCSTDEVVVVEPNRGFSFTHTTDIPTMPLTWRTYIWAIAGAKTLDIERCIRLQDI